MMSDRQFWTKHRPSLFLLASLLLGSSALNLALPLAVRAAADALPRFTYTFTGEDASYTAWNNGDYTIESIEITQSEPKRDLFSAASMEIRRSLMPGFGGGGFHYGADTGHRVPEDVEISWRKPPSRGAKPYTGEQFGPYRVKVRSLIPSEVLSQIREPGYSLAVSFSVGRLPIQVCWVLEYYDRDYQQYMNKMINTGNIKQIDRTRDHSGILEAGGNSAVCCLPVPDNLKSPLRRASFPPCRYNGTDPLPSAPFALKAFWQAVARGEVERLKPLLAKGIDPGVSPAQRRTFLAIALNEHALDPTKSWTAAQRMAIIATLLDAGADLGYSDKWGYTPFLHAAESGSVEIIRLFLSHGADPNETNAIGVTPLMLAAGHNTPEVVAVLLEHGALINMTNNEGTTALMYAVLGGHLENVRLLLEHGANPNQRTRQGDTAITLARQQGFEEIENLLRNAEVGSLRRYKMEK